MTEPKPSRFALFLLLTAEAFGAMERIRAPQAAFVRVPVSRWWMGKEIETEAIYVVRGGKLERA